MSRVYQLSGAEQVARTLKYLDRVNDANWWPRRYHEGCHFATPAEAKEYLDLCLGFGRQIANEAQTDSYMAAFVPAQYPLSAAYYVAGLLERAEIELSESDERKLYAPEQYLTEVCLDALEPLTTNQRGVQISGARRKKVARSYLEKHQEVAEKFENSYLREGYKIAVASALIDRLVNYWEEAEKAARWRYRTETKKPRGSTKTSLKRTRRQQGDAYAQAGICAGLADVQMYPLEMALYDCFGCYNYVTKQGDDPGASVSRRNPSPVKIELMKRAPVMIKDMTDTVGVSVRWHEIAPVKLLGEEKLTRLMELHAYATDMLRVKILVRACPEKFAEVGLAGLQEHFPEIPSRLYRFCTTFAQVDTAVGNFMISVTQGARREAVRQEAGLKV